MARRMSRQPVSWGSFTRVSQVLLLSVLIITLLAAKAATAAATEWRRQLQNAEEDDSECLKGLINQARPENSTVVAWNITALETPCSIVGALKGVTCNKSRVVAIELPSANLAGTIPSSLSSCKFLQTLDLSSNSLSGKLPSWLGTDLLYLSVLSLSNNNLSGPIPDELATLGTLTYVDLSRNQLSGSIPPQFGLLDYLQYFNVSRNNFSGLIPSTFTPRFNASSFANNSKLFGYPLSPSPPFSSYTTPPSPPDKKSFLALVVGVGLASGLGCLIITLGVAWLGVKLRRRLKNRRHEEDQWLNSFHRTTHHNP